MKTYGGAVRTEKKEKSYRLQSQWYTSIHKGKFKKSLLILFKHQSFSGTNINQLDYYIVTVLVYQKPMMW